MGSNSSVDGSREGTDTDTDSSTTYPAATEPHNPTPADLARVILILTKYLPPAQRVPLELAFEIINYADYYPVVSMSLAGKGVVSAMSGRGERNLGCKAVVITDPLPKATRKVKKVEFWLKSRDQGWSGEDPDLRGTYKASYTWFEAAILRPVDAGAKKECRIAEQTRKNGLTDVTDPNRPFPENGWRLVPVPQSDHVAHDDDTKNPEADGNSTDQSNKPRREEYYWNVQFNRSAVPEDKEHEVVWYEGQQLTEFDKKANDGSEWNYETGAGWGVGFVESLQPGDRVVLLAKAQFPGWVNNVNGAAVKVTVVPV